MKVIKRVLSTTKEPYNNIEMTAVLGGGSLLGFMMYFDDKLERRFSSLDNKFTSLDSKLMDLAIQSAKIEIRMEKIEVRMEKFELKVDKDKI
jgi:hypothetical protein